MSENSQIVGTAPHFLVKDVVSSVRYYHEVLGFDNPRLWGDPPEFAMPKRDGFIFMLHQVDDPEAVRTNGQLAGGDYWDAYIWIRDADALFAEFTDRGAIVQHEPVIRELYDMKEFAIRDPDDHIIAFGQHHQT